MNRSLSLASALALGLTTLACDKEPQGPGPSSPQPPQVTAAPGGEPASTGDLAVGSPAPAFDVKGHTGTPLKLAALRGRPVVLYFYPKDETPGCTKEACAFRDGFDALSKRGVMLIGVSADTDESHRAFASNHKLPFQLVSDAKGELSKAYGVPFNNGFVSRHTIVIDPEGKVFKLYRSVQVNDHAAEITKDIESMKAATPPVPPG